MEKKKKSPKTKADLLQEIEVLKQRLDFLESGELTAPIYRILLDESTDPIFAIDGNGNYLYVNQAFANGVGRELDEIINHRIWDVFPREEAEKRYAVVTWVFENKKPKVFEVRVPRADGDRYYITSVKPVFNQQGEVVMVNAISKEITERKTMEEELRRLSNQDLLTGLFNRNFYESELHRLQHSRLFPISIIIADLDNLKAINDQSGHPAGDSIIQQAAAILRKSFREEDIIARIGGDEFAVLLPETPANIAEVAIEQLRKRLADSGSHQLKLSIGLATGAVGSSLDHVMKLADDRMYEEKRGIKNRATPGT
jgi:diguanylate cyclase (GGDEF)-like protein/PAS domain S-box-containing protein